MKKNTLTYIFILFSIYSYSQINKLGIPFTQNYNPDDYQAEAQNWGVVTDNRGVVYFANNNCILEFDGSRWTKISIPNNSTVRALAVDKNGTVFVGAYNELGYLSPSKSGTMKYHSLVSKIDTLYLNFEDIWKVYTTKNGVYFSSHNYLFKYNYSTIENINATKDNAGNLFFFTLENNIFLGNFSKGLLKLKNQYFENFSNSNFLAEKYITSIIKKDQTNYLASTFYNGIFLFNTQQGIDTSLNDIPYETNLFLKTAQILNSYKISDNLFSFSTNSNGVIFTDKNFNVIERISRFEKLMDNVVYQTTIDTNTASPLWGALNNGISKIEYNSPYRYFDKSFGYDGSVVDIIKFKDTIFLATNVGVFYLDFENNFPIFKKIDLIQDKPDLEAWNLEIIQNNNVQKLAVATNFGVFFIDNKKAEQLLIDNNIDSSLISTRYIKQSNNDELLLGLENGFFILTQNNTTWEKKYASPNKYEFRSISQDADNNIWCGTHYNGIIKIDNNYNETIYGIDKGLTDLKEPIVSFINNELIIASPEGLFYYSPDNDTIIPYTKFGQNFNTNDEGYYVFCEKNQNIWFSCYGDGYEEIKQVNFSDNNKLTYTPYKRINFKGIQALYTDDEGIVWIGTPDAVYSYNTNFRKNYNIKFNTLIRKVYLKNDSVLFNGTNFSDYGQDSIMLVSSNQPDELIKTLRYSENTITIEWSATFFENEQENLFSYKIEGFDKDWSKWTTETKYVYTNLPEGEYIFKVKSKNVYDIEGTTAEYKFTILPPWYRTIYAFISYIIFSIFIIFIIIKWYTRKLKRENIRLEKIVDIRTKEIRLKNTELEQQKEEIIAQSEELETQRDLLLDKNQEIEEKNESINASIQYASKIQRAILPPLHPLEKNFSEYFILYIPRDIVSGDFYWFRNKGQRTYVIAADCTGHGVPGAFMSMLGVSLLNEIIEKNQEIEANELLNTLRDNVIKSLHQRQEHTKTQDGMDLSLLIFDNKTNEFSFAGANNPLIIVRNENSCFNDITKNLDPKKFNILKEENQQTSLIELKADRMPIGVYIKDNIPFAQHKFKAKKGDTFYIFSDGFPDQFGGKKTQKYMIKNLKKLFIKINVLSLVEQKETLEKEFYSWINCQNTTTNKKHVQIDDVIILSLKI